MQIWLLKIGETLPFGATSKDRPLRMGMLASALTKAGHDVLWWTSTFDHVRKKLHFPKETTVSIMDGKLSIRCLHSYTYKKNISFRRLAHHWDIAHQFLKLAEDLPPPGVILACLPTTDFCAAAADYGVRNNVPFVVDVRDLWPDDILNVVPRGTKTFFHAALAPMRRQVRVATRAAAAIFGTTPQFVKWGLRYAGREATPYDQDFPLAYPAEEPPVADQESAFAFWRAKGVGVDPSEVTVCYCGVMSWTSELEPVIDAATKFAAQGRKVKFVFCGHGDKQELFRKIAGDSPNMTWMGWLGRAEVWALLRLSQIGLAVYTNVHSYMNNLPNKVGEYLSAGLAFACSTRGQLGELVTTEKIGFLFEPKSPESFYNNLVSLLAEPERIAAIQKRARELYLRRFVAEDVFRRYAEALVEIANRHQQAQR